MDLRSLPSPQTPLPTRIILWLVWASCQGIHGLKARTAVLRGGARGPLTPGPPTMPVTKRH